MLEGETVKTRRKIFPFPKYKAHPDQEAKTPPISVDKEGSYYSQKLSGERLKLCYSIAPPRVKQYLEAEVDFVLTKIKPSDKVLELGCGYGRVLLSSYAERFWEDRLAWFLLQAEHGLIGEIDEENTGEGLIVCKDGFKAKTVTAQEFRILASELGLVPIVTEVDGSSLFCELRKA